MRGAEYMELRAFIAIAEQGSFRRASSMLGVSASAVSQTLKQFEARLGVRLLNRTTRSVSLTEAGAGLLARAVPAMNALEAALGDTASAAGIPKGRLRINSARMAAIHYLSPLLGPFLAAYPGIALEVVMEEALVDMVAQGYDAGVRLGERLEQDMVAVRLSGPLEMKVVAAPAYLERFGTPASPHDLLQHDCLSYRRPSDGSAYRWEFERAGKTVEIAVDGPLMVSDPEMLTRVAQDGAGIAYLFSHQVQKALEEGSLIQLLQGWTPAFPGFYLYYPSGRQMSAALRAFIDFLSARTTIPL